MIVNTRLFVDGVHRNSALGTAAVHSAPAWPESCACIRFELCTLHIQPGAQRRMNRAFDPGTPIAEALTHKGWVREAMQQLPALAGDVGSEGSIPLGILPNHARDPTPPLRCFCIPHHTGE